MRILYLSESSLASDGADSVHVVRMSSAFSRAGHDVTLWAWRGDLDDAAMARHYGADERLHIVRADVVPRGLRERAAAGFGPVGRILWLIRRTLGERAAIRSIVQDARPDVVFARNLLGLLWVDRSIPVVFESHRPPEDRLRRQLERWILRGRLRRLVVISGALAERYERAAPALARMVLVAHDAADDPFEHGTPQPALERATDAEEQRPRLRVGHVGHLYEGRGAELLLDVAERLPDVEFHFVGGAAEDVERIRRTVADRGMGNVVLHGHRPPSELASWYASFDVLVAPYQRRVTVRGGGDTSAFMSPMKLFEYLSWGAAIVFSDLPVIHEVLQHERDALLVEPDDVDAWVRSIERFRDEPGLAQRLGAAARQQFLAEHTWDHRARRVLADLGLTGS
jgi:glycosyltransferase involved in cell wall biosynthesis